MEDIELDVLELCARGAISDAWYTKYTPANDATAAYIAACNPSMVLELIAEVRKSRATQASIEHWKRVAEIIAEVLVEYQEPAGVPVHKRNTKSQILKIASYIVDCEAVKEKKP